MPTLTVTFNFSSDNGDAELFVNGNAADFTEGFYDGAEGNPSGSLRFDTVWVFSDFQEKRISQTFEDWGVPSGSTITSVSNLAADAKRVEVGSWGNYQAGVSLFHDGIYANYVFLWPLSGDLAWTALTADTPNLIRFPVPSTETLILNCDLDVTDSGGTSVSYWYDNITFDINYTLGADSAGTGTLQAQAAEVDGEGSVEFIAYATGVLQAQDAVVAGYSQSLPSATQAIKVNTADSYILYADGVSVPLIQFTVRRNTAAETAAITAPVDFEDIIAAATVISIDMVSTDVYGTETTTELFTGALADYSTSRSGIISNCTGAASWPANAVRDFGNVSYITDDANYNAYRLSIDPRFYPGDVGMYGLRRININRVTFSVNQNQAFMELSSVGQV